MNTLLFILFIALNGVDTILTLKALKTRKFKEGNPIIRKFGLWVKIPAILIVGWNTFYGSHVLEVLIFLNVFYVGIIAWNVKEMRKIKK